MGRPLRFDESYADDVRALQQRGYPTRRIAKELGMSKGTVYNLSRRP